MKSATQKAWLLGLVIVTAVPAAPGGQKVLTFDALELRNDAIIRDYFTIVKEVPPALAIARSGTDVLLSWPASQTNYVLHSTTNLASPISWQTVTNVATNSVGQRTVRAPNLDSNRFFRLEN